MMTLKNHFSKFILALTALICAQPSHAFISDKAQGICFASAAIGLGVMNEELSESETFGKLARFLNMHPEDLAPCMVFSSALWAASYIPEGNGRTVLRLGALVPVLAAACLPKKAIKKLAELPGIKHFFSIMREAKGLPLVGDMAQCNRLECQGLCHECKARKLYLTVPFAAIPFVPTLYRSLVATVQRWEHERIQAMHRPHFEVLGIPEGTELTQEVLNHAFRTANLRIHPDRNPIQFQPGTPEYERENRNRAAQLERIRASRAVLRAYLQRTASNAQPDNQSTPADQPD